MSNGFGKEFIKGIELAKAERAELNKPKSNENESRIELISSYINSHIFSYLISKITKRGGLYELNDNKTYQSLLVSNFDDAFDQVNDLLKNHRIAETIIENAVYTLNEQAMLDDPKLICDDKDCEEAVIDFILKPLISIYTTEF